MATTINSYSVSLALDASNYVRNSSLSREATRDLRRDIAQARSPMENFSRDVDRMSKALEAGAIDQGVYNRLLDSKRQKLAQATNALRSHTAAIDKTNAASAQLMTRAKGLAATYLSLQTAVSSVRLAVEAEQAAVQFEVLTGSIDAANTLIADSKKLAASSPLSLVGAQQAYRTLLSFGIAADQTSAILRRLSDVTGGNEERFKMLTLAYAQASAAGRLQGQDLLQMINAGFNPLQERAQRTGQTLMELRDIMQKGGYSARMMAEDFITATDVGGRFNGMTDRLAETMGGKLAQSMSKLQETSIALGQSLEVLVTTLTVGVNDGNSALQDLVYWVGKGADGISLLMTATQDFGRASYLLRTDISKFLKEFDTGKLTPATDALLNRLDQRDAKRKQALQDEANAAGKLNAASEAIAKQQRENAALRLSLESGDVGGIAAAANRLDDFNSKLREMQTIISNGGQFSEDKRADIDAIRSLFDTSTQFGKRAEQHFEQLLMRGIDYNRQLNELLNADQLRQLERFRSLRQQSVAILRDQSGDLAKQVGRSAANALSAARAQFDKAIQNQARNLQEIAKTGAGSGFEVGSAEAARFMADQQNARIAGMVNVQQREPTEASILEEARKQSMIQEAEQAKTDRMLSILERHLEVAQQNGFKRIR